MLAAYQFEFGTLYIEYDGEVLYKLRSTPEYAPITPEQIKARSPFSAEVFTQTEQFISGRRKTFDLTYRLVGTPFQLKVWRALQEIPYGHTATYKQIAEAINSPAACRAVGMANNKNPLFLIVPCHRVIGSDGSLTGYAGGLEMKRRLLQTEASNSCENYSAYIDKLNKV